jgi:hypothetical protein
MKKALLRNSMTRISSTIILDIKSKIAKKDNLKKRRNVKVNTIEVDNL